MTIIPSQNLLHLYNKKVQQIHFSPKPRDIEADAHTEGNLAAEVSMVALELIIQVNIYFLADPKHEIFVGHVMVLCDLD